MRINTQKIYIYKKNIWRRLVMNKFRNNALMLDMNPLVINLFPEIYKVIENRKLNDFIADHQNDAQFSQRDSFEPRFKNEFIFS